MTSIEAAEKIEWPPVPGLPGVSVLHGRHSRRRWRIFHETYTLCILDDVSGGDIEWTYRARRHIAGGGELTLMEPGEIHANTRTHPPCSFRVVFVEPALAESAGLELGGVRRPHLRFAHVRHEALFAACARLHASIGSGSSLEQESHLASCLQLFFRDCTESGTPDPRQFSRASLLRTREFISANYCRTIRLEELARVAGLSRYHLVHAFAREFGLPPHAYQTRIQLERARKLIAAGVPPAIAAADVGFADQSHLTRHFRRVYGITPGHYARSRPRAGG